MPQPASAGGVVPSNWACPLPTFCMFIGATNVCGTPSSAGLNCTTAYLTPTTNPQVDGANWRYANEPSTLANINGGQGALNVEGGYPFANSAHATGCNMGFCDGGVRFISKTIDGTVYAKLITSAGTKLPANVMQLPLNQDPFAN